MLDNVSMAAGLQQGVVQEIQKCLPKEYHGIMSRIVKVESGGNPYAININNGLKLSRQPSNAAEATAWSEALIQKGYSIDMGLGQINSQHIKSNGVFGRLGLSVKDVFDPCTNLRMSSYVFGMAYYRHNGDWLKALSAYNTGNGVNGFKNGYVARVLAQK